MATTKRKKRKPAAKPDKRKVSKAGLLKSTNLTEYQAAGGIALEGENWRILEQLVRREVGNCVSMLVGHFAQNADAIDGSGYSYDDVLDICRQDNWETPVREDNNFCRVEYGQIIVKAGDAGDDTESEFDEWRDAAEALGIDEPITHEAYEHWIVSDWFADKLKKHGEITGEFFNLTLWGRCGTGQSIYMDCVIAEIAAEMQILVGQQNDWSKQK